MTDKEKIKVNLISGTLGAGKTTLIRNLLSQKPGKENWLLLVNEFGSVGIDGAILEASGKTEMEFVPGGCICCTAKSELFDTLVKLGKKSGIDRLIIEPTGLGEPDAIVDLFKQPELSSDYSVYALCSVIDLESTTPEELETRSILQSLVSMADVLVLNKADLATETDKEAILNYCRSVYPPKEYILVTEQARIDAALLEHPHFQQAPYQFTAVSAKFQTSPIQLQATTAPHSHESIEDLDLDTGVKLKGLQQRKTYQGLDTQAIGWIFEPEIEFEWSRIFALFESFSGQPEVKRAKGVFRIAEPWMLFQYVNGQATRELIAYRKDSRFEILFEQGHPLDITAIEQAMDDAMK